ncbi:MAG: glycosyltransferase family 9 protein [Flavobacteriales bacterium]|nr:glycosyltransferase family 9 protein [Flavobacteriales bacterium]
MEHKVKILVIRFSSIGDIVLTTPVLRCLKNQLEGEVEIHYLTKKQYKSIVENNPNVSKVYSIEKSTEEVVAELENEFYDYVVDLHKNLRSKRVVRRLKCLTFSFHKLNYQKWLMTTFKIDKLPRIHIVERYLAAVQALGIENDNLGLEFYIPEKDKVTISSLPITHQNGYVAFAIGAQHTTKRLPNHKIIELCKQLNLPVILLGGKEDEAAGNLIHNEVGEKVCNACGKYNLNQSASLVEQSKVLITHDTGLMHIGAALGKKIISVWGNTIPEFGMYPYFPKHPEKYVVVENKNLKCRPCTKIGYDKCPKGHFKCMEELKVNDIIEDVLL